MNQFIWDQFTSKLDSITAYCSEIESASIAGNTETLPELIEYCQRTAIETGELLEGQEGEDCPLIPLIEEFCESLYEYYMNIQSSQPASGFRLIPHVQKIADEAARVISVTTQTHRVDISGSCFSRVILLDGQTSLHHTATPYIEMGYFFDKNNIAFAMMPPPFSPHETEAIRPDELYDGSRIHSLKQCLNKSMVSMIMQDDADYLILDLYDYQVQHAFYKETAFSPCAHEFFNTELFRKYQEEIGVFYLAEMPDFLIYPYYDLFFEKIRSKFDSDHIILNRFRACSSYIDKKSQVQPIPEQFLQPYHANFKYNEKTRALEDYIIKKYNPYVIDLSKYFMGDESLWENLNGAHFQKSFYQESLKAMLQILFSKSSRRVYDTLSPGAVSEIFGGKLDDYELLKYLLAIETPFQTGSGLDGQYLELSNYELVKRRKEIAQAYAALPL